MLTSNRPDALEVLRNSAVQPGFWPGISPMSDDVPSHELLESAAKTYREQYRERVSKHEEAAEIGRQDTLAMLFILHEVAQRALGGLRGFIGDFEKWRDKRDRVDPDLSAFVRYVHAWDSTGTGSRSMRNLMVRRLRALTIVMHQREPGRRWHCVDTDTKFVAEFVREMKFEGLLKTARKITGESEKSGAGSKAVAASESGQISDEDLKDCGEERINEASTEGELADVNHNSPSDAAQPCSSTEGQSRISSGQMVSSPPVLIGVHPNSPFNDREVSFPLRTHQDLLDFLHKLKGMRVILIAEDGRSVGLQFDQSGGVRMIAEQDYSAEDGVQIYQEVLVKHMNFDGIARALDLCLHWH